MTSLKWASIEAGWICALILGLIGIGCEQPPSVQPAPGSIGISLMLSPVFDRVDYEIHGPAGFEKSGWFAASEIAFTATIDQLPVGAGYEIRLIAASSDRSTVCTGKAVFDVAAGVVSQVAVQLRCPGTKHLGAVEVNGTISNVCPVVSAVTALGSSDRTSFSLVGTGNDEDDAPEPISYRWTVSAGTLSDATSATTDYACPASGGDVEVSLSVQDGDCGETATVATLACAAAGGPIAGAGGAGAGGGPAGGSGGEARLIASGEGQLIAAFSANTGILVVLDSGVRLVERSGAELARWNAPRPLTAAAFDGELLGVSDGAILTGLNLELSSVSSVELIEPCSSAVLLSQHRFICGPANDWDRIFYTYDLAQGALLARSLPYTYNGEAMRRVPGSDRFVTVTEHTSPSDFHLYLVGSDNAALYIGESPYHGDFPVENVYAFDAVPARHLVTHTGWLLAFDAPGCAPGEQPSYECFVKDGSLGTLREGQEFVAMTNDADLLYGLAIDTTEPSNPSYLLQSIDVAQRAVTSTAAYSLETYNIAVFAFDRPSGRVVVGYEPDAEPSQPQRGYRIELLDL
jgi:hypothetical protein